MEVMVDTVDETHLDIAKRRLDLIRNTILEEFSKKCHSLQNDARKHDSEAIGLMDTPYGREDGLDYARDLFVDSQFEEKAIGIFEQVMSSIIARIRIIEKFIAAHSENGTVKAELNKPKTECMVCETTNGHLTCGICGRVVCTNGKSKTVKLLTCDECRKPVCSLCVLFKFEGKVRCVECYEDIVDYPEDWIPDEWLEEDDEY